MGNSRLLLEIAMRIKGIAKVKKPDNIICERRNSLLDWMDMIVKRTKATEQISNVVSSMAIENMFYSKEFIEELIKVAEGKKTSEELRKEVIKKYV